jgi:ABC-2 type transport system ATP-binding protein
VREQSSGAVTETDDPIRPEWSWRRGRHRHEYWPDGEPPAPLDRVDPDLEDIVISLSMARRAKVGAAP